MRAIGLRKHSSNDRDDRTRRLLSQLVGERDAPLALTHFMQAVVQLSAASGTLATSSGFLAFATAANMLTRFVGHLVLRSDSLDDRVNGALQGLVDDLREVDSRQGKQITLASTIDSHPVIRLHIGGIRNLSVPIEGTIFVTFDGWAVALRRNLCVEPIVPTEIPFGALLASCFGVSEVFKEILIGAAPSVGLRTKFTQRLVNAFDYSSWFADRTSTGVQKPGAEPPEQLPNLEFVDVLQVGAGAVGNATVLALTSSPAVRGWMPMLDPKLVDIKNLNRCLYFTDSDLEEPKVKVVERRASRPTFRIDGQKRLFTVSDGEPEGVVISTVDNNDVRHSMQESLPEWIVQGSTSATNIAVSVHNAVNGRSCLICRHPDRRNGLNRIVPLSIDEAAARLRIPEDVVRSGASAGSAEISSVFLDGIRKVDPEVAEFFEQKRAAGQDLCGALGDFRARYGIPTGPKEPSIPFASAFAGFQAAAEAVKIALLRAGLKNVPVLENVLEIDLGVDYARHGRLSFSEPPRTDCPLCQDRRDEVSDLYSRKWILQS